MTSMLWSTIPQMDRDVSIQPHIGRAAPLHRCWTQLRRFSWHSTAGVVDPALTLSVPCQPCLLLPCFSLYPFIDEVIMISRTSYIANLATAKESRTLRAPGAAVVVVIGNNLSDCTQNLIPYWFFQWETTPVAAGELKYGYKSNSRPRFSGIRNQRNANITV